MPLYQYYCEENDRAVDVTHGVDQEISNWGELCFAAQIPLGSTDPAAPVRRVIRSAPSVAVQTFDSEIRNAGFTKLVKRDDGVYENVTASGDEARYMKRGDSSTMPKIEKKIRD